jgi:hypothetical protein
MNLSISQQIISAVLIAIACGILMWGLSHSGIKEEEEEKHNS